MRIRIWLTLVFVATFVLNVNLTPITSNPKIVIIGAGTAGIAAGVKLLDYGFQDVIILEAEPRIGGRIHTIPFADNVVDLGAEWCHGETDNVVYDLVKDRNLLGDSMKIHRNVTFYRSNGEKVPEEVRKRLVGIAKEMMSKRFSDETPYNGSVHDFFKEEFYKALERPENMNIDSTIAAEFFENYEKEECSAEGSDDLTATPLRGDFKVSEGNQGLNWKDKGYKELLRILMRTHAVNKEFGVLEDHIRLSERVKHIHWERDDSKVMIILEDGEEILADHVIVTVPLGVLKAEHKTLFNPCLPIEKQKAIEEIGFGTVNKIFLEFDKQFWPECWTGLSLLWTEEDLKTIRSTEKFWWEGLFGIFTVDYQPRVFELWLIGPSARHMETLDEDELKSDCVELLECFLKWDIPEPKSMVTATWYTNDNFKGTWSYHSIKMIESGASPRDLEEPLNVTVLDCMNSDGGNGGSEKQCEKPVVLFAGEASNSDHFSTVHGAVETGWREAQRLADYYGVMVTV